MAAINPYQAPQTVASLAVAGEQTFELGPEFLVVAKGARLCYAAVVTVLVTVVAFIVFGMILGLLGGLIALAMPVIFLICGVMHLVGVLLLSKIDPASRAPGLLTVAAVLFGLSFFGSVILTVMQLLKTIGPTPEWVNLVQSFVSGASNILLLIALQRIGTFVQHPQIRSKATGALVGICLVYAILIVYIGMLILAVQGSFAWLAQPQNLQNTQMIVGIALLVLGIYALISYSSALSLLGKLPHLWLAAKRSVTAPLQLPSSLNIPVPGKEMDFMQ